MTEADWLAAADPGPMLAFLHRRPSERKVRWFCIACCRQVLDQLDDPRERRGLLAAEQLADGVLTETDRRVVEADLIAAAGGQDFPSGSALLLHARVVADSVDVADAASCARDVTYRASLVPGAFDGIERKLRYDQVAYVRDIFGNPFRPVTFNPRWRTADAVGLARRIYEDRAFARLPVLADALLDAGCEDDAVIGHCRHPGLHVRGCWVVDEVLGKG